MAQLNRILLFLTALLLNTASLPIPTNAQSISHGKELSTSVSAAHNNVLARNDPPISDKGLCGRNNGLTCLNSFFGDSCSESGFCGSYYEMEYAGPGCQTDYGVCNPELATRGTASTPTDSSTATGETDTDRTEETGIVIQPVTTTVVDTVATPIQTVSGRFGFCGVRGSSC